MSDRCAETIQIRRGLVSLRCDRKAGHAGGHFDMANAATWREISGGLLVGYEREEEQHGLPADG